MYPVYYQTKGCEIVNCKLEFRRILFGRPCTRAITSLRVLQAEPWHTRSPVTPIPSVSPITGGDTSLISSHMLLFQSFQRPSPTGTCGGLCDRIKNDLAGFVYLPLAGFWRLSCFVAHARITRILHQNYIIYIFLSLV